ncbi:MAG: nitrilase-related carbon-nitrogen hydrolase, partial [Rhodothermales bacterium]
MRIALAQIDPIIGDLRGNARKIIDYAEQASGEGADLVVFPELSLTGYPPQDLLESDAFLTAVEHELDGIAASAPPAVGLLLGAPVRNPEATGKRLFNAALLFANGEMKGRIFKVLLPTYDVYDEYRYFE